MSDSNPPDAIRSYVYCYELETSGEGWYRFAKIIFKNSTTAEGSEYQYVETLVRQTFNNAVGCFHKISLYLIYKDKAKMVATGQGTNVLSAVRAVRKDNIIYLDVYSTAIKNTTEFLINIPIKSSIASARCIEPYWVSKDSEDEIVVCSKVLTTNIS